MYGGVAREGYDRINHVQRTMAPMLTQAAFGSRTQRFDGRFPATNLLTYVNKLAKATVDTRFEDWYDWLTDAAHPAWGARIAMGSDPHLHDSRALFLRYYARAPLVTVGARAAERLSTPSLKEPRTRPWPAEKSSAQFLSQPCA